MRRNILFVLIILIVILLVIGYVYLKSEIKILLRLTFLGIGKDLYFKIEDDDNVDYNKILEFQLLDKSALNRVSNYMRRKNLRIKPGVYIINQTATTREIIDILEFEEIK